MEREQWCNKLGHFHVEHFESVSHRPHGRLEYDNLLYSCQACNLLKADQRVPDPLRVFTSETVMVKRTGVMLGKTKDARLLIDLLQLNSPSYRQRRRLMLAIIRTVKKAHPHLFGELMRFPDDLPNLSALRPPGGNSRPRGIKKSFHALRLVGKLAEIY